MGLPDHILQRLISDPADLVKKTHLRKDLKRNRTLVIKDAVYPNSNRLMTNTSLTRYNVFDRMRMPLNPTPYKGEYRVHTSDRDSFRRCRRRFGFGSSLRGNFQIGGDVHYFWLGSGVHFALEDFHGYNRWKRPARALIAYGEAQLDSRPHLLPDGWFEALLLGVRMLDYYSDIWLASRDPLQTLWVNGHPQVEVRFRIPLPPEVVGVPNAYYFGTIDRVVVDELGNLWLLDYKTYKKMSTTHLELDPQVTAYCWASTLIYEQPVQGMILQQHLKSFPELPKALLSGNISVNKTQNTDYTYYRIAINKVYGDVHHAPPAVLDMLEQLRSAEETEANKFVRRDYVLRSAEHLKMEELKILAESRDMLDPNLILYPTPTRDCSYSCPFYFPCVAVDDGGNAMLSLEALAAQRRVIPHGEEDVWRAHLRLPHLSPEELQQLPSLPKAQQRRLLKAEQQQALIRLERNQVSQQAQLAHLGLPTELEVLLD